MNLLSLEVSTSGDQQRQGERPGEMANRLKELSEAELHFREMTLEGSSRSRQAATRAWSRRS